MRRSSAFAQHLAASDKLPLIALAGVVLAVSLLIGRIAVTNHNVFVDEAIAILYGRAISADPSLAFSHDIDRGLERLTSLVTALIVIVTDSASRELWLLHAFMALSQGLVAVPTWLAGRLLGLSRWAALAAAAVASTGSFAFYGIFTLNQAAGLLAATAMLWAMVRTLRRPGPVSDLVVVVGLAATALARIGWAPLVVAIVPGALAAAWFEAPDGEQLRRRLRAFPARVLRRHPLLVPAFVAGSLWAITREDPATFLGYGTARLGPDIQLATLWDNTRFLFSHLAIGLALVPFILALPMLVRDLVRPADATSGGFAWVVLGLVVALSYVYYSSLNEDRYFAVLVPPFALAGALAVFRRPPPVWAVLVSGLLSARLIVTSYAWPGQGPFDFFLAPTSLFLERVVVGELAILLPFSTPHVATLAMLGAVGAALVVAVVARMSKPRRPLAVVAASIVLAGVLVFQVASADHAARRFVKGAGTPDVPLDALTFIDRATNGGRAQALAVDDAMDPRLEGQIWFLRVYNHSLGGGMAVMRQPQPPGFTTLRDITVSADWRTGNTAVVGTVPNLLVQYPGFKPVGLSGELLPLSPYFRFAQLMRLHQPLDLLWMTRGDSVKGYPERGHPLRLRIFPPSSRERCVQGGVAVHRLADRASRYRISGAPRTLRGVAQPGVRDRFVLRVEGGHPTTLVLAGVAGRLRDGRWVGPTVVNLQVGACP